MKTKVVFSILFLFNITLVFGQAKKMEYGILFDFYQGIKSEKAYFNDNFLPSNGNLNYILRSSLEDKPSLKGGFFVQKAFKKHKLKWRTGFDFYTFQYVLNTHNASFNTIGQGTSTTSSAIAEFNLFQFDKVVDGVSYGNPTLGTGSSSFGINKTNLNAQVLTLPIGLQFGGTKGFGFYAGTGVAMLFLKDKTSSADLKKISPEHINFIASQTNALKKTYCIMKLGANWNWKKISLELGYETNGALRKKVKSTEYNQWHSGGRSMWSLGTRIKV